MSEEILSSVAVPAARRTTWLGGISAWRVIAAGFVGCAVALSLAQFLQSIWFTNAFLHPAFFRDNMLALYPRGAAFSWDDLTIPFWPFAGPEEYRPRFLTYGLLLLDHHVRFFLYKFALIPPTLTPEWPLEIFVTVFCLPKIVKSWTGSWIAGLLTLAVYLASVGFLSGFTFLFMPGKPLTNVLFIAELYLAADLNQRLSTSKLLFEQFSWRGALMLVGAFAGLWLDEIPIFVFALVPAMFPGRFLPRAGVRENARRTLANAAWFALPAAAFLILVIWVVPIITETYDGYRFDYLRTLLNRGPVNMASADPAGPLGLFSVQSMVGNLWRLTAVLFVPWQVDPFLACQCETIIEPILVTCFFAGLIVLAWRGRAPSRSVFRRLIVTTLLFVIFQSIIQGRHNPVADGFYYGSAYSVFFALLIGLAVSTFEYSRAWLPALGSALCLALILLETNNFLQMNKQQQLLNYGLARDSYRKSMFPAGVVIDDSTPTTSEELHAIWQAAANRDLGTYARSHPISSGAIYLVAELNWNERCRRSEETEAGGCQLATGPVY